MRNNILVIPAGVAVLMASTGGDTNSPIFIGLAIAIIAFVVIFILGNIVVAFLSNNN